MLANFLTKGQSRVPTIEEIEQWGVLYKHGNIRDNILLIGRDYVVKKSTTDMHERLLMEIENLRFVAGNTTIPIPEVVDILKKPDSDITYMVMKRIPGRTLGEAWASLTEDDRTEITTTLRGYMDQMRALVPPEPTYFGGVNGGPLPKDMFCLVSNGKINFHSIPVWAPEPEYIVPEHRPWRYNGPFHSEVEYNEALHIRCIEWKNSARYALRKMCEANFQGHRSVFTHGDLQRKNIMVTRISDLDRKQGDNKWKVTLIDWEGSGWYPEYWDFCFASQTAWKLDYSEYLEKFLDPYYKILPMFIIVFQQIGHYIPDFYDING